MGIYESLFKRDNLNLTLVSIALLVIKMYHLQRLFISWLISLINSQCPCVLDVNPYTVSQDVEHQTIIKTI